MVLKLLKWTKSAKSVDVNWLSFARMKIFTEPLGQHFSGNILQRTWQNKKYSIPGLRGLGTCNLSLESDVSLWFLSDSSGLRSPNQSMCTGCRLPVYKISLSF